MAAKLVVAERLTKIKERGGCSLVLWNFSVFFIFSFLEVGDEVCSCDEMLLEGQVF